MATNNYYIPSDKITIFPSSSRTTTSGKYGNNFLTEHTVANTIRQLIKGNGFVITTEQNDGWLSNPFLFNIYGYFVQIDEASAILTYVTTSVASNEVESFVTFRLGENNVIYAEIALDNISNGGSVDPLDNSYDYLVGMEGIMSAVSIYEQNSNRDNTISLPILNVEKDPITSVYSITSIYQDSFLQFIKLESLDIDENITAAHDTFTVTDDDVVIVDTDNDGNSYKIELSRGVITIHTTTEEGTTLFKADSENGIIFIGNRNAYTKIEKNNITSISINEEDDVTNKFTVTDGDVTTTENITANKNLYIDGNVNINKTKDTYGVTITKIEAIDTSDNVTDTYSEISIDNITKIANGVITNGTEDNEGSIINKGDFTNELGTDFIVKKTYSNEVTDDAGNEETVEDTQHFTIHEVTVDGKTYLQIDTNLPIIVGTEDKYTEIKDGTIYNTDTIDNNGKITIGNGTDGQTIINNGGITIDNKAEISNYTYKSSDTSSDTVSAYRITADTVEKTDSSNNERSSGQITITSDSTATDKKSTIITDDNIEVDNISTNDIVAINSLKAGDQNNNTYTISVDKNTDGTCSIVINGAKFTLDASGNVTISGWLSANDDISTSGSIITTSGLSKSLTITLNGNDTTYNGSSNADESVSFYAPTSKGNQYQYYMSNGSGDIPGWQTPASTAEATTDFNSIFNS